MARPASAVAPRAAERVATGATLGAWIRSARASQGISQRALADRSGLSRSYLCDIERGRETRPSVNTLDKLAVALGASRPDLLRAAGFLESGAAGRTSEGERRLLAIYRDLSPGGSAAVERFARFVHAEEHRWIQPPLLPMADEADRETDDRRASAARQDGPTLFDSLVDVPTVAID